MAYENIQVKYPNFAVSRGYFYNFDYNQDNLIVKTDDGNTAFTYPLDTALDYNVVSCEYDGFNFWTLEKYGTAPGSAVILIKRWQLENYVCKLKQTFTKTSDGSNVYESNAMTVEHYHLQFSGDEGTGESNLSTSDPEGIISDISTKVTAGMTVCLGPSTNPSYLGLSEQFTVSGTGTDFIVVSGTTSYAYKATDPINTYNKLYVFNNYSGVSTSGSLYVFNGYDGSYITKYTGNEYDNIEACTFSVIPQGLSTKVNSLSYVRGSNLLFKNIADMTNYGSMAMDNINSDGITIISVYDIKIEGSNIYRLQTQATYYGSTYTFASSAYSYQLATLQPFVYSVSMTATPAVIPADTGVSNSLITALVKSQFLLPIVGRLVVFADDDSVGYLSSTNVMTDGNGQAQTTYYSGSTAREVKITATVRQS